MRNLFPRALAAVALSLCIAAPAFAARPGEADPLTPQSRGQLAEQFVRRWGHHVERVYDIDAGVWAQRVGVSSAEAERVLRGLALHSNLPEPLRVAHLMAGALARGESRGRV